MRSRIVPTKKVYTLDEISEIVAPIAKEMGVEGIYVFGSYARGEATPESDIDFLIECGAIRGYFGIGSLYYKLNVALRKNIDIITIDTDERIESAIKGDLIRVYTA